MEKLRIYKEYCTGCGLCKAINQVNFQKDRKGFTYPDLQSKDISLCTQVCPAAGTLLREETGNIWGKYESVFLGWALDEEIREHASSGGVLTAICLYLLENHFVDAVIQTKASRTVVYETQTVISRTRAEVLECMGSRYSISSPLERITDLIKKGERYAFVGKPCDVYALKGYMAVRKELKVQIPYMLSFFCAGMPSKEAQEKLLARLGCSKEECMQLKYRGDGWPGYASVRKTDDSNHEISYEESWGQILGRDVRKSCRFCLDGVGEFADIACGDAWYLKDGRPDFSEAKGRNVIFARSKEGLACIAGAVEQGILHVEDYNDRVGELAFIQKYQYERKATMGAMLAALKSSRRTVPLYPRKVLRQYGKQISFWQRGKRFFGAWKRVLMKRI